MQKIFSFIGIISVVIIILYFGIITPITSYNNLESENAVLKKQLEDSQKATELVYKQFDAALRYHLDDEQVDRIYSDTRYFQKTDTEICVSDDTNNSMLSYTRLN